MKNTTNQKKAFLLLATYLIILFTPKRSKNKEKNITYNKDFTYEEVIPYATYDDKQIYIIDPDQKSIPSSIKDDDIIIIDKRNLDNSTMTVYDSQTIKNRQEIETILNILINYENEYPSEWNRTLSSMEKEWIIHNICYFLNYQKARTRHVDLDNNDEENFSSIINILSRFRAIIDDSEENETTKTYTLNK